MKLFRSFAAGLALFSAASFSVAQTVYKIESVNSGKVLDVTGYSADDGAPIQQWDYNGTTNQHWTLEDAGGGAFFIRSVGSGKVLDVEGASTAVGAYLHQWSFHGGPNQQWYIDEIGDGVKIITSVNSGLVLDVEGGSTENGARVYQWDYWAGANQQWRLFAVGTSQPPTCDSITNSGSPAASFSFEVYANNVQNASRVIFPTWTDLNGQDELIWYEGEFDAANNRWKRVVNISEHNNELGSYTTHVYALGTNGQWQILGATYVTVVFAQPVCDSVSASANPSTGASYEVYANNVRNVTRVIFPTWTDANGQDELIWYEGEYDAGNNRWKRTVRASEHNYESGSYTTHAYGQGADGQIYMMGALTVTANLPAPVVSLVPANNTVRVGEVLSFVVNSESISGNDELGLELCDTSGTPTTNLGLQKVSGSNVSSTFNWTAPGTTGTYLFDGYAWSADRTKLTRTAPVSIEVLPPAPAPLTVSVTVTSSSIGVGQKKTFSVSASGGSGVGEVGLELCNVAGVPISTIGTANASSRAFSWMATSSGAKYFRGYAKNAAKTETVYTALRNLTVLDSVPGTRTLSGAAYVNFNADDSVHLVGGQTIKIDTVTGFVTEGRLNSGNGQYLDYGPGRDTYFQAHSMIRFAGAYVCDGYMDNSGSSESLYYGPGRSTDFAPKSRAKFRDGYVSDGYMNNSGSYETLYYGPGRSTNFAPKSHVKFAGGYVSDGYMANSGSYETLYYGPGRSTRFLPQSHVKFRDGYVSDGYMANTGTYETLQYGSSGSANFLPQCHVTFAGGYVATGSLINDGNNSFRYRSSGTIKINIQGSAVISGNFPSKKAVNEALKRIDEAWEAIMKAMDTSTNILFTTDGKIQLLAAALNGNMKDYMDQLSAAEASAGQLPILYSQFDNYDGGYTVTIKYPPVAFTPGADGRGYLAVAQLAEATTLQTATGSVNVSAGTVCAFSNGYYVP